MYTLRTVGLCDDVWLYIPQFRVATHLLNRIVVGEPSVIDDIMVTKYLCVCVCVCVCVRQQC